MPSLTHKYAVKRSIIEAWQWLGQPKEEWPKWLGVVAKMLETAPNLEHGWYFIRQDGCDRASCMTKDEFEATYKLTDWNF